VAVEVGFQDTILFLKIGDDLLLVPLEPATIAMSTWRIIAAPQGGDRDMIVQSSIRPT
jgi:hypothetical protein